MNGLTNNGSCTKNLSLTEKYVEFHFCVLYNYVYANRYVPQVNRVTCARASPVTINYFGTM